MCPELFRRHDGDQEACEEDSSCQGSPYTITAQFVARPVTADVVTQILYGSSPLTGEQLVYLDQLGNDSGVFDVGDFLAWLELNAAPAPPAAGPKEQE
jgi:hypothetical protein